MRVHHCFIALFLFVTMGVVVVSAQIEVTARGLDAGALEQQRAALEEDNRRLAIRLAEEKTLERLEERARDLDPPLAIQAPWELAGGSRGKRSGGPGR